MRGCLQITIDCSTRASARPSARPTARTRSLQTIARNTAFMSTRAAGDHERRGRHKKDTVANLVDSTGALCSQPAVLVEGTLFEEERHFVPALEKVFVVRLLDGH